MKMLVIDKKALAGPVPGPDVLSGEGMIICIDKPLTWTSADVVRKIRFRLQRYWQIKKIKVGHTGTLDPLATGLLIICAGKATRLSDQFQSQEKEYVAGITFGATTPSFDLEHPVDKVFPWEHITFKDVENALHQFIGEQMQLPPVYSAKVIEGVRAYEFARQGMETPEMKTNLIRIRSLKIRSFDPPVLTLQIHCSKGTYIRALARDLGQTLGSGAHLTSLQRSGSGNYRVKDAISIEDIDAFFN